MSNYGGYGQRPNPYDQRDAAPANNGGYGGGYGAHSGYGQQQGYGQQYGQQQQYGNRGYGHAQNSIDGGYAGSGVELAPLAQNGASVGRSPNAILNECTAINKGMDAIKQNLRELETLQHQILNDANASSGSTANRDFDALSAKTMDSYRALVERLRTLKLNPESQTPKNITQVKNVAHNLQKLNEDYQKVESGFRQRSQEQMVRQYKIVRPEASEQEARAAAQDPSSHGQVFQQALMQSNRHGQARSALGAVQDRHEALVKIEQQLREMAQLIQDIDSLVVQQEPAVAQIEQKGEEVVDNLDKGNEEIGTAVNTARSTRKKKWICLGISVAIVVIVVVIVVIYFLVIKEKDGGGDGGNGNGNAQKRSIELQSLGFIGHPIPEINSRIVGRSNEAIGNMARLLHERIHMPQLPN